MNSTQLETYKAMVTCKRTQPPKCAHNLAAAPANHRASSSITMAGSAARNHAHCGTAPQTPPRSCAWPALAHQCTNCPECPPRCCSCWSAQSVCRRSLRPHPKSVEKPCTESLSEPHKNCHTSNTCIQSLQSITYPLAHIQSQQGLHHVSPCAHNRTCASQPHLRQSPHTYSPGCMRGSPQSWRHSRHLRL
jgi:hypothetical protein